MEVRLQNFVIPAPAGIQKPLFKKRKSLQTCHYFFGKFRNMV